MSTALNRRLPRSPSTALTSQWVTVSPAVDRALGFKAAGAQKIEGPLSLFKEVNIIMAGYDDVDGRKKRERGGEDDGK